MEQTKASCNQEEEYALYMSNSQNLSVLIEYFLNPTLPPAHLISFETCGKHIAEIKFNKGLPKLIVSLIFEDARFFPLAYDHFRICQGCAHG